MSPKEAYLSIKASKAREDAFYGRMAGFVATLANVAGSGPKKPIKPEQLYKPQLSPVKQPKRESTPEDTRAAQRSLKEHVESLIKEVSR